MQYRQGDVFIEEIAAKQLPKSAKPVPLDKGRVILAYGEATGHAHVVEGADVQLMAVKPKQASELTPRYLRVGAGGARIVHDEHAPIALKRGLHRVKRQREYSPPPEREQSLPRPMPTSRPVWD